MTSEEDRNAGGVHERSGPEPFWRGGAGPYWAYPVPDARRVGPGIAWKERRTAPRHASVWVRVGGRWRRGRIIEWARQIDRDGWDCVIMADEPVSGPPWQGRYADLEIDLSARNARSFRSQIAPFIEHGRKVSRGSARRAARTAAGRQRRPRHDHDAMRSKGQ